VVSPYPARNPATAWRTANESKSGATTAGIKAVCVVVIWFSHPAGRTDLHEHPQLTTKRGEKPTGRPHEVALEVPISSTWNRHPERTPGCCS
jgi:hypothetical protein